MSAVSPVIDTSPPPSPRIRITQLLAPHWKTLTLGLLAAVFCSAMDLLQPWPLKIVIDQILGSKRPPAWLVHMAPGLMNDRVALLNATALTLIAIAVAGAIGTY